MNATKYHAYALRLPRPEAKALAKAQAECGLSRNQLIIQCVRQALADVVAALRAKEGRITNVDPLPDEVLERIYSNPERDEAGIDRFAKAQAFGGRD
jgi:chaperonin GroEL (HSP60 family)